MTINDWTNIGAMICFFAFILVSLKLNRDLKKADRDIKEHLAKVRETLISEQSAEDERVKTLLKQARLADEKTWGKRSD
jgi:uncharacterized membrane-anchored protein YhcB (DUF1043 family)